MTKGHYFMAKLYKIYRQVLSTSASHEATSNKAISNNNNHNNKIKISQTQGTDTVNMFDELFHCGHQR